MSYNVLSSLLISGLLALLVETVRVFEVCSDSGFLSSLLLHGKELLTASMFEVFEWLTLLSWMPVVAIGVLVVTVVMVAVFSGNEITEVCLWN